eukprot:tig00021719_g23159.t1
MDSAPHSEAPMDADGLEALARTLSDKKADWERRRDACRALSHLSASGAPSDQQLLSENARAVGSALAVALADLRSSVVLEAAQTVAAVFRGPEGEPGGRLAPALVRTAADVVIPALLKQACSGNSVIAGICTRALESLISRCHDCRLLSRLCDSGGDGRSDILQLCIVENVVVALRCFPQTELVKAGDVLEAAVRRALGDPVFGSSDAPLQKLLAAVRPGDLPDGLAAAGPGLPAASLALSGVSLGSPLASTRRRRAPVCLSPTPEAAPEPVPSLSSPSRSRTLRRGPGAGVERPTTDRPGPHQRGEPPVVRDRGAVRSDPGLLSRARRGVLEGVAIPAEHRSDAFPPLVTPRWEAPAPLAPHAPSEPFSPPRPSPRAAAPTRGPRVDVDTGLARRLGVVGEPGGHAGGGRGAGRGRPRELAPVPLPMPWDADWPEASPARAREAPGGWRLVPHPPPPGPPRTHTLVAIGIAS